MNNYNASLEGSATSSMGNDYRQTPTSLDHLIPPPQEATSTTSSSTPKKRNLDESNVIQQLGSDWSKLREPASKQLIESRRALKKLRAARGDNPPSQKEIEIQDLVDQLTAICQQIDAQFLVVQKAAEEKNTLAYEHHLDALLNKISGWHAFFKLGLVNSIDFYQQWLKVMGIPEGNRDPHVLHYLAAFPKDLAACRAWEAALIFPRKISSMMEVGCKFGINALLLSRMIRMGAVERNPKMIQTGQKLEKSGFAHPSQLPIGFTHCFFQHRSPTTIPQDTFDALWFHRGVWNQWINQDGPQLVSAIAELAHRVHFLLFTTTEELPPKHELISSLYDLKLVGEHEEGVQTFRFFVAQRRSINIAGSLFACKDIKIQDPGWQGFENLGYGAKLLPWNNRQTHLQTRRYILGHNQVIRTFLKRTINLNARKVHQRETEIWPSVGGSIPELPTIKGHSEDTAGFHLLLDLHAPALRLATPRLTQEEQEILLYSALRILRELRSKNLYLNFLRLDHFVFIEKGACFLTTEFISYEELEDSLDAFLWLLRDFNLAATHWHCWPIETFVPEMINYIPEQYRELALLALQANNIDQFLNDPLVMKIINRSS